MSGKKQFLLRMLFVIVGLFATFNWWNPKMVTFTVFTHTFGNTDFRLYYTTDNHPEFNKDQSVLYQILSLPGEKNRIKNVKIELPIKKITGFKFVMEQSEAGLEMSSMLLKGKKTLDFVGFKGIDVPVKADAKGTIHITPEMKDIVFSYPHKIDFMGKHKLDPYFLLSLLLGFYGIVFLIEEFKTPTEYKPGRLYNIEFYRIWATFVVAIVHTFSIVHIWTDGWRIVNFFFLVSGYFLAMTFKPEKSTFDFLKAKVIRWMPLLLFGGFLARPNVSFVEEMFFLQNTGMLAESLRNLPAWYLGVLFWSSLFIFYVLKAFKREQANLIIGVTSFVSLVIYVRTGHVGFWQMVYGCFPNGLFQGLGVMGAGYFLYLMCPPVKTEMTEKTVKKVSVFEFILLGYVMFIVYGKAPMLKDWIYSLILQAVLIYLFVRKKGAVSRFLDKPIWARISKYTLALYLTHWGTCSGVASRLFVRYNNWVMDNRALYTIGIVFLACLVAVFAHHVIEEPAAKALTKYFYGDKK